MESITYHRKPTAYEIKFGEGATHYKDFDTCFCWNDKTDKPKKMAYLSYRWTKVLLLNINF